MDKVIIPTLLFWENGNTFYGSCGPIRFFIRPVKEEGRDPALEAEVWRGPLAMEYSEIFTRAAFPLSEEGLEQVAAWLEQTAGEA